MEEACGSTCDSHSCRLSRPASLCGIGALVAWNPHLGGPLGGWPPAAGYKERTQREYVGDAGLVGT